MPLRLSTSTVAFGGTVNYVASLIGSVSSAKIVDYAGNEMPLNNVTGTSAKVPALGDGQRVLTGPASLVVTTSLLTLTKSIEVVPPEGYASVLLMSPFIEGDNSFLVDYSGEPQDGDEFLYPIHDATLDPVGSWTPVDPEATVPVFCTPIDGGMQEEIVLDPAIKAILTGQFNDKVRKSLVPRDGTVNDALFDYLGEMGYTGSLSDRIEKAGGWKWVIAKLGL